MIYLYKNPLLRSARKKFSDFLSTCKEKEAIKKTFQALTQAEKNALAVYSLQDIADRVQREKQRMAEARATEKSEQDRISKKQEDCWKARDLEHDRFSKIYDDPRLIYGTDERRDWTGGWNYNTRARFKSWCKRQKKDLSGWIAKAIETASDNYKETAKADWHYGGVFSYYRAKETSKLLDQITVVVDQVVKETRLKVTEELLGSEFSLGDGRKVTWGLATKKDHKTRILLLSKNAAANVKTASKHQQAINLLEANKVKCLGELKSKNRAA